MCGGVSTRVEDVIAIGVDTDQKVTVTVVATQCRQAAWRHGLTSKRGEIIQPSPYPPFDQIPRGTSSRVG